MYVCVACLFIYFYFSLVYLGYSIVSPMIISLIFSTHIDIFSTSSPWLQFSWKYVRESYTLNVRLMGLKSLTFMKSNKCSIQALFKHIAFMEILEESY